MNEFCRPAESRISTAIAFIVVVYSAKKVVCDSGIKLFTGIGGIGGHITYFAFFCLASANALNELSIVRCHFLLFLSF